MNEQDEGKEEEKLELVFGTEKLLESAKEPFVGEVTYAVFPCHCEDCEKGARTLEEKQKAEGDPVNVPERLHVHIKPLTVYTKEQSQWWNPTKTKLSRWGDLQKQLEKLGVMDRFKTDGFEAFMGMIAEWHWVEVEEVGVSTTKRAVLHWIPVRILTEEEVTALKASQSSTGDLPSGESGTGDAPSGDSGTDEGKTTLD